MEVMMTNKLFTKLETIMKEFCEERVHDIEHIYRVLTFALDISRFEKVNTDILITAVMLHDIGRSAERRNQRVCHAVEGAKLAKNILKELSYSDKDIIHVQSCIRTHRFRVDNLPESIEAKVLHDADKLDATGCIGIARTIMYKGVIGEPLYNLSEDLRNINLEKPSFVHEYNYKLRKISERLYTQRAREICCQREQMAQLFYEELIRELNDRVNIWDILNEYFTVNEGEEFVE